MEVEDYPLDIIAGPVEELQRCVLREDGLFYDEFGASHKPILTSFYTNHANLQAEKQKKI